MGDGKWGAEQFLLWVNRTARDRCGLQPFKASWEACCKAAGGGGAGSVQSRSVGAPWCWDSDLGPELCCATAGVLGPAGVGVARYGTWFLLEQMEFALVCM